MSLESSRSFAASSDLWRRGHAFHPRLCSTPCAPIRRRAPEFFELSCRHVSVKRAPTTPSLFTLWNVFSISRLALSLLASSACEGRAASCREGTMADASAPVKGTRPEGAVSEADASNKVRAMFTQIAPRYDLLNHLLSLQFDRLWRARAARRMQATLDQPGALALDLCRGTGDLGFALARSGKGRIIGADFAHTMLV